MLYSVKLTQFLYPQSPEDDKITLDFLKEKAKELGAEVESFKDKLKQDCISIIVQGKVSLVMEGIEEGDKYKIYYIPSFKKPGFVVFEPEIDCNTAWAFVKEEDKEWRNKFFASLGFSPKEVALPEPVIIQKIPAVTVKMEMHTELAYFQSETII